MLCEQTQCTGIAKLQGLPHSTYMYGVPQKECPKQEERSMTAATSSTVSNPFPPSVSRFAVGFAHTTQENFTKTYDLGVPIDRPQKEGDTGVLILYNTPESMPRTRKFASSGCP